MNKYLVKVALSRLVKEIANGNVKRPLKELARKGFIRNQKVYASGMKTGNTRLAEKYNIKITAPRNEYHKFIMEEQKEAPYASMVNPDFSGIIVHGKKSNPLVKNDANSHHGSMRHEIYEHMDVQHLSKDRANIRKDLFGNLLLPHVDIIDNKAKMLVGDHHSPRVLTRESEMVRKNPYLRKTFINLRKGSGEDELVHRLTGKIYGQDPMTNADHKKAFNSSPDEKIKNWLGQERNIFYVKAPRYSKKSSKVK